LFPILFWAWAGPTFYADRFDTDDSLNRLLFILFMFGMGGMTIFTQTAHGAGVYGFIGSYIFIRSLTVFLYFRAARYLDRGKDFVNSIGLGFLIAVGVWGISLLLPSPWRYMVWLMAMVIDFGTPWFIAKHLVPLPLHRSHINERFGLFTIIILGEGIAAIIHGLPKETIDTSTLFGALIAFVVVLSYWWLYFSRFFGHRIRTVLHAQFSWLYIHVGLLLAMALSLTTLRQSLEHIAEPLPFLLHWTLSASVGLVLLAFAAMSWITEHGFKCRGPERAQAAVLVFLTAFLPLKAYLLVGLIAAILGLLMLFEHSEPTAN
jgi:low temperature requirement protein LtrA